MDDFNRLSLEDNEKGLDSDIWNLSLNDPLTRPLHDNPLHGNPVSENYYIPNVSTTDTNTSIGGYIDNSNSNSNNNNNNNIIDSSMDIDSVHSSSTHDDIDIDIDMIDIQSTDKQSTDHDVLSDTESIHSTHSTHSTDDSMDKSVTVSKLLLSPTQLGASLVTNNNNNHNHNHINTSIEQNQPIRHNNDIWKQLLTDKQLINVNINNHNYFTNNNDLPYSNNSNDNLIMEREDVLPLPWSTVSTPHFKKWYNTISIVQWGLNAFSIIFIIYLLLSSMSKDMRAIWYQNKMALINESQNCQLQYNLNHCEVNFNLPEMSQVCQDWWICSHRDNTKLINNRTNLLIKFITSLINEFIDELNWKTLFVSIVLILGWFFISNFTMGFIRAKTYYGSTKNKDE